jgi:8-amino-7-oxononanoate synthase
MLDKNSAVSFTVVNNVPMNTSPTIFAHHMLESQWQTRLSQREKSQQKRHLRAPLSIDFVSNDYLGWARASTQVAQLDNYFHALASQFGDAHGATGSRLLSGQTTNISTLESAIAQFHQTEAALIFNSGFDANVGVLSAIGDRHTVFLYDELCHASLIDGMRLSMSRAVYKFRHNDVAHLTELLTQYAGKTIVIVIESVYSMDGDVAPLREIVMLARATQAGIVVDEAHATTVIGKHGEGLTQSLNLHNDVAVRIHTYGKGMGCHGAVVVGSQVLIELLINFARPFVYSTALPPLSYATIARAYSRLQTDTQSRAQLHERIGYFNQSIQHYPWDKCSVKWLDSRTPIQGLVIGDVMRTHKVVEQLHSAQLDVRPIFAPTVPAGTERLRICLHAFNTHDEIDLLCLTLWKALQKS